MHQLYPFYYLKSNEIIMGDSRGTMTGQYIWTHIAWQDMQVCQYGTVASSAAEKKMSRSQCGAPSPGISCHYQVNFHQPVEKVKSGQPFPLKESS